MATKIRLGDQTQAFLPVPQAGVPAAGLTGEVLTKVDDTDYNYGWVPVTPNAPTGNQLLSGGGVAWTGTGLDFIVSAATYLINGTQYSSPQTLITLEAADPTDDRIDVFAVDVNGDAIAITGTPGGPPLEPQVDPTIQLRLTSAIIRAGATEPEVTNEYIYLENTEWVTSVNAGTINPNSTTNPFAGSKDIEGTACVAGNAITFEKPALGTVQPSDFTNLVLQIRSKAGWPNPKALSLQWINEIGPSLINVGSPVAIKHGSFGYDSSITTGYQQIVIPVTLFNTAGADVDRLQILVAGGGGSIGFYLDNILLQFGIGTPPQQTTTIVRSFPFGHRKSAGIATGKLIGYWTSPYNGVITGWNLTVDQGTIRVKIWKKAAGSVHPTVADSISTSGIEITSGTNVHSDFVGDFTNKVVSRGDIFAVEVVNVSGGVADFGGSVEITQTL